MVAICFYHFVVGGGVLLGATSERCYHVERVPREELLLCIACRRLCFFRCHDLVQGILYCGSVFVAHRIFSGPSLRALVRCNEEEKYTKMIHIISLMVRIEPIKLLSRSPAGA